VSYCRRIFKSKSILKGNYRRLAAPRRTPQAANCFGRVERRREKLRPMTSAVSALSGIVANGHQAILSVSSAPSKIPYGGFSPVRLQTRLPAATFAHGSPWTYRPLPSAAGGYPLLGPVIWTCVPSGRASRRFRPSRPVALGSASGYAVRQPHRLLWPHPSFCQPRRVYVLMPGVLDPQKVPTFICQSLLTCRRLYSDGSSDPQRTRSPTWPSPTW
jgi:hypothetical protein